MLAIYRHSNLIRVLILSLFLALSMSSCFAMGIPEHFAPLTQQRVPSGGRGGRIASAGFSFSRHRDLAAKSQGNPRVLLLQPNLHDSPNTTLKPKEVEYFGHQYVFGIIPLTRLFFAHGTNSYVMENAIEELETRGWNVFLANARDMKRAAALVRPEWIIMPMLPTFSLNVYDLLLLRNIDIRGSLRLDFFMPNRAHNGTLSFSSSTSITAMQHNTFRNKGQAPILSHLAKEAIKKTMGEGLDGYHARYFYHSPRSQIYGQGETSDNSILNEAKASKDEIFLISPPEINPALPSKIKSSLSSSYGFTHLPPFSEQEISRLVQRGLHSGFTADGHTVVSASARSPTWLGRNLRVVELESNIENIELLEAKNNANVLKLTLSFTFSDLSKGAPHSISVLNELTCSAQVINEKQVDGHWIFALENAANSIGLEVLNRGANSEAVSCE